MRLSRITDQQKKIVWCGTRTQERAAFAAARGPVTYETVEVKGPGALADLLNLHGVRSAADKDK